MDEHPEYIPVKTTNEYLPCKVDMGVEYAGYHPKGTTIFPTVDGRNPASPGMYKNLVNNGIFSTSSGVGFLPSTVSLVYLQVKSSQSRCFS